MDASVEVVIPSELFRALHVLEHPEPVFERALRRVGGRIVEIARERYLSGPRPGRLQSRTGNLAGSVMVDESALPNEISVGARAFYGSIHEFGATISAKVGGWLLFRGGPGGRGGWMRAKTVEIPARPFIGPAAEDGAREFPVVLQEEFEREAGGAGVDFS